MASKLHFPATALQEFCQRHQVRKLALFGSVLREDFRPDSDIDVLIEFMPGQRVGLRIARMERELSQMLDGRKVDLRTPAELSQYFRDTVLAQAEIQYVAS